MSLVKYAVASAMVAGATSANALDISTYAANAGTNINVYISGSTSIDNTLLYTEIATASPGGLCAANTIDVYQIGAPSQRLTYCSAAAGLLGITAGDPLAIFKESNAGSINGVAPLIAVAKGHTSGLSFITPSLLVADGGDADCTTSTVAATLSFSAYTLHAACDRTGGSITSTNVIPTGGIADVEASLLRTVPGGGTLSTNDIRSDLSGAAGLDVVWGVSVTKNLYYALQVAEHLTDGTKTGCSTANNDSPACAPTLTKAQVASLYQASGLLSWDQIIGISNATDNNVYVCRRDVGSGAEASFEAYFLGARCGSSSESMATQDGQFVITSSSTGNLRNCLRAFFSGGTITPYNGDFNTTFPPVTEPGGQWAIGVLSTEVTSMDLTAVNGGNDSFRMIAVDGVLPTLANTVNGFWPYFSTDMFYTVTAGKTGAPSGLPLAAFTALQVKIRRPALLGLTNSAFAGRPWGNGGDLAAAALFQPSNPPTIPATNTTTTFNPTNVYTKMSGGSVNNCDTPVLLLNQNTAVTTPVPSILLGNGNLN